MSAFEPQIAVEWIGFCSSLFRIQVINMKFLWSSILYSPSTDDYLSGLLVCSLKSKPICKRANKDLLESS